MNKTKKDDLLEQEKHRKLTEKEQKRLVNFEALSDGMLGQGYRRTDLTVSVGKANIFAILLTVPVAAVGVILFFLKNGVQSVGSFSRNIGGLLLFLVALAALVVAHELIHGLTWSLYTEHRFGDIEFGFMKEQFAPYCTCLVPLTKKQYILGALMPFILLGLLPMAAGILAGSWPVLFMGIIMTASAAGDIMIVRSILKYRSTAETVVYMDHPTQAGGVIFEK
ncbi:MAG: DUF3267 domain-containing protein [Oscillospiraceae bacterium]|nr:DUF3267 domain-containing protein [Oscillospiraceae bacterium]MBO7372786.1 DUF3267 domain-containing protein [Oscillospiraceae bacterium]MBP5239480.1 DUF3267 domain-containing protein [Oscillospiraceae bacterium]MBP5744513.1 DUF3267 domain-containing protein [Oscillospiraceae bacterium]